MRTRVSADVYKRQLHEVVDQLKSYFPTAVSVTGRDSQDEKQRAVDSFQNNPKTDIIICSIKMCIRDRFNCFHCFIEKYFKFFLFTFQENV